MLNLLQYRSPLPRPFFPGVLVSDRNRRKDFGEETARQSPAPLRLNKPLPSTHPHGAHPSRGPKAEPSNPQDAQTKNTRDSPVSQARDLLATPRLSALVRGRSQPGEAAEERPQLRRGLAVPAAGRRAQPWPQPIVTLGPGPGDRPEIVGREMKKVGTPRPSVSRTQINKPTWWAPSSSASSSASDSTTGRAFPGRNAVERKERAVRKPNGLLGLVVLWARLQFGSILNQSSGIHASVKEKQNASFLHDRAFPKQDTNEVEMTFKSLYFQFSSVA